ncbi:MAG: helix-turn-helix domain-containing protein [Candidatus Moraniibacteriota bacterium]
MDKNLTLPLQSLGFDEKEAKVYLALLELGQGTATEIATHAGLKRAIVYHVIDRLKKLGYAQEVTGKKIKEFSSSDPLKVLQNVSAAAESFRSVLPIIQALQDKGRERPRIEFFEGKEAVVSVYRMYSEAKTVRYLSSIDRLSAIIPDEVERWIERLKLKNFASKECHLLNDTKKDREWVNLIIKAGLQGRILPKNMSVEMDFTIADDILGITSFDPLFIVVIYSEKIARSAAQLFDLAWLQGQKV